MAELMLSSLLPVLFEKLTDAAFKTIARHKGIDAEIKKLQKSLISIQLYLTHASQMEITDPSVKQRLNDLQHLAYDIEDVLDGWATDAMDPEFKQDPEGITGKVRKLITPTCCTTFSRATTMIAELDDISTKLQDLVNQKADLGLENLGLKAEEETRPRIINNNRRLQTSVVNPSSIVGRQAHKDALVQQLLLPANEPCDQNYSIVPIIGMGGVGKTTLARLVYDEQQVKDHFDLKAWVCVSDEFDTVRISKEIFQSMANKEVPDFNRLQEALKDHVKGKKFLLVLDDIWSESYEDWETLVRPLYTCASGSKIIITTRKDKLLKKLGCNPLNKQLESLSDDDALSLVARNALGVDNFDSHLSLKPYAEGIVKKCGGLPLALIALGRLLRTKKDEVEHWKEVLNSEIWRLNDEDGILLALRLSYHDLSAPLKRLFVYCSLFPKDFLFDKEDLVLLWMANGFLQQATPNDSSEEQCLGRKFFEELLSRSFFQHAPNNESLFVMHDLMNDLATSVAGEFLVRLDGEAKKDIGVERLKYRYMSFVREKYVTYEKFKGFTEAIKLRTFLATSVGEVESWRTFFFSNKIITDLLPELPFLRVLSLSNFKISEVPESVGTLRHLRYLNLSRTSITHLPEKVCNLFNLQTLILFGCDRLTKLPNNFLKLKNLRHLDVRETKLLFKMLLEIGKLKSLQISLSKIYIESESGVEIAKLKDFENLYGKISVVGLEKVQNAIYAHEANFSEKRISELELVWGDELNDSRNDMLEKEVLNELKPCHDKLLKLKLMSYGGFEFPNWVGDPSFLCLTHVSISGCKRCTSIPPLGQLPSLKELLIKGLHGVEVVGFELFGTGQAFPSLEILSFDEMRGWKEWSGAVFPRLQKLEITGCPNLVEVTLEAMLSLNVLKLYHCDSGVLRSLVEVASAVTKLRIRDISGLNDVVWGGVIEYLGGVEELSIDFCKEIRYMVKSDADPSKFLVKLRKLVVWHCDNLVSIGEKEAEEEDNCRSNLLTSLRTLYVSNCKNMERCSCPDGIEELRVRDCSSMTVVSFPKGGQEKLRSLAIWDCRNLIERGWGGQKTNNNNRSSMPMLEYVVINNWPNLKSITELNDFVHLTTLRIENCENLESFPDTLKSLKELEIRECPRMDACLPGWVWPPNMQILIIGKLKKPFSEWGPHTFPTSLVQLELYGGGEDGVSSCSQISHLLPSSLTSLRINEFDKLESVSMGLQHLTSLQELSFHECPNLKKVCSHPQYLTSLHHLTFWDCPKMKDLPEMLLPSLLSLYIDDDCPVLKERCSKNGSYWPLIFHIPYVDIQ
ncbi:putative P-loop containing nucleoside triphosphate hydrolase, leucine-rich repeat domain superfamily [Helianthus annuus]|nr:putative P-loop containing nucleoside triphosphate hydrolase, leucine-rich repeat domain superfamily [Helianthus annuus]KAJ0499423.1 putative P-loop containing nucleoside triphosphate hydrolase, leucine-rich repeat domain superfamily [Helianthus annuus]KAJ0665443.1 putative P-loop containing nucleoside triphosphate hydrolase, leucine-rich repeat domain superfamily [Helianthus annuus]